MDKEDKAQIKNHLKTRATVRWNEKNKLKVRLTEKMQKVNSKLINRRSIFELRLHQRADRKMRKNSPKEVLVSNLVCKANESTIIFCGEKTPALIDIGSMVTTVSEDYLNTLHPKPEIIGLEELVLSGLDGKELPYLGYIEATIQAEFLFDKEISVPALVVPSTSHHSEVSIVVGTNVIRICKDKCRDTDHIPTE